ncbi:MAG: hypothetical protein JJ863_05280 [Deltaproteobacteria bacterium]|nr:hypothetical protein [Deltaproteobacteria bacterium]
MRFRPHNLVPYLAVVAMLGGCTIHHVRTTGTVRASGSVRVTTPTYVTVADAPPPLKPAVQTRPAASGSVWIEGHWSWNGGWVWADGHWDTPPQPGYVWEPPVCVAVADGGYQFHRGYWRPQNQEPPAIYRTDGTIRVHVRPADEPARANRVVVTAREPAPRGTVVVTSRAPEGNSSSVTVTSRPANGSATVTTRPANGSATVTTRPANGGATVTTRPSNGGATVTTRPSNGGATVTTRPSNNGGATVRTRPGDNTATATTTVRPASTARGNNASANTTVRPASTARGNNASANTTVRPASTAQGNNASANTTVRPASTARGNNASANTAVRPASTARGYNASANTTVRTPAPNDNPGMQTGGPRSCSLAVAVLPRNGVLVIRGSGLAAATGVMIGSQRVPLLDKRDDRVRARVQGRNHGGSVRVLFGNDREECGSLRITGR